MYLSRHVEYEMYIHSEEWERVNENIQHYQRVVAALAETIELMGRIDVTIEERGGWPIE